MSGICIPDYCFSSYRDLGHHKREAEGEGENKIYEKENSSAVLRRKIGEAPYISKSDGRARRREDETDFTGERASLLLFSCCFFHCFSSFKKCFVHYTTNKPIMQVERGNFISKKDKTPPNASHRANFFG